MPSQNHQHEDNWTAAGMASMFETIRNERDRRRYRWGVCLWTLTIAVCLGVPLWITWEKFQDARRQTLLEEFETHRPAAEQLNQSNPAVVKALSQADTLRSAVHTQTVAESIAALRQALTLLAEAHDLDRNTKRLRQLLDPVGKTLVETPWHVTSTKIDQRQKALGEAQKSIVALLEQGQAAKAEKALADLLTQVGLLQRDNVEAMKTETARQAWVHMKSKIPQRLTEAPALAAIYRRGTDGDRGWDEGDWNNSRLCYSGAADDLQKLLEAELSPDEKAKLLQSDTDALARLETEKADLNGKITSLEQQLANLGQQLATTNGERQEALAQVKSLTGNIASLTTERDRLKTDGTAADAELKTLRPLKKQVEDLTSAKTAAEGRVATLTAAKEAAEGELKETKDLLAASDQEAKDLRAALAAGGNSPRVVPTRPPAPAGQLPTAANIAFVPIPVGSFLRGSAKSSAEKPVRSIMISKSLFAGKHEVTIGQVLAWLNSPDVVIQDEWIPLAYLDCPIRKAENRFVLNSSSKFGQSTEQPMVFISWYGAVAFCDWCSQQDPRFKYRLPTEAEWEYMARAGSATEYSWGDSCNGTEANINGQYPYGVSTQGPYLKVTTTVGSYPPNAWGLYDTAGNVWEWCGDWYDENYYASSLTSDPQGPNSGVFRVSRGGSWLLNAYYARVCRRGSYTPTLSFNNLGFRVVAE